jgi:diadenosine tetraphosphatase ApaH/serine/threonine PP2A family protein phosphatase
MSAAAAGMGMERIALISDIHGNIPAIEAVLTDLVGKGPHGDLAVDTCRARCERIIRGNWDEGMTQSPHPKPAVPWRQARLGPERLALLNELPATIDFIMSGRRVRLVHASPQGVEHRVHQTDPLDALDGMFACTPFTGFGFAPDVVGYGDIHSTYLRTFRHKMLFNVGSVGKPLDLTLACYVILEGAPGNDANAPLSVAFIRLPYDIERAIREAADKHMPDLAPYSDELRMARYRGRQS